jgi:carboxymethylenebutenolidase
VAQQSVSFSSEGKTLHGVLFRPEGDGPFPALLYNHGSAPGMLSSQAFDQIGPRFVEHGWVFFAPYRRGQGSSADAGPFIGKAIADVQMERALDSLPLVLIPFGLVAAAMLFLLRRRPVWIRSVSAVAVAVLAVAALALVGMNARAAATVQLLETDHLADHVAAQQWLQAQHFVRKDGIATGGNSFGGIITLLGTERIRYCAAFDAAGGAQAWQAMAPLRERMRQAVRNARAPILFLQAGNDYSVEPSRALLAELRRAGKAGEMKLYPPFGDSTEDGHAFAWRGSSVWADDVFRFLDTHCAKQRLP